MKIITIRLAEKFTYAACFASFVSVVSAFVASAKSGYNAPIWSMIDMIIFLTLGFGVFKKSRSCAIFLFFYYILGKIQIYQVSHHLADILNIISIFLVWFYFLGIIGTFKYKKEMAKNKGLKSV